MAAPAAASPPKAVTCGEAITAPGHYFLASDCSGDGIRIEASGVRLKLAGHTMDEAASPVKGRAQRQSAEVAGPLVVGAGRMATRR